MDFRRPSSTTSDANNDRNSRHLELPSPTGTPINVGAGIGRHHLHRPTRKREHNGSGSSAATTLILPSTTTINDQYLPPELRSERERLFKSEHKEKRRPSPSGRSASSRDGNSRSRPLSAALSYGPDIRDPRSQTPPRVGRPRSSGDVNLAPPISQIASHESREHITRLLEPTDDRDGRVRFSTPTPQLPTRVSDGLDDLPPDYESLLRLPNPPSSRGLPRSVSNPASPANDQAPPSPSPSLPLSTDHNQLPTSPFFPFGIVSTDHPPTGRRPLPSIPGTRPPQQAPNPLPRRVSSALSDDERPQLSTPRSERGNSPTVGSDGRFLNMTDLDWVVSQLEDDETAHDVDYETILTLEEIIGPSANSAATRRPDPLGRAGLKPSGVVEDSRRYNSEGKLKLKLSLAGVRVERCGICLAQFVGGDMGILTWCRHAFHAACLERWAAIKESCPACRSPLDHAESS